MIPERFGFAWHPSYSRANLVFGIRPANTWVEVGEAGFDARFGPWRLAASHADVAGVEITGPYHWYRTAGPARLGVTDRGLTFATNGDRGVLITFRRPVRGHGPYKLLTHPELTVTVAEPERLMAALTR